MQIGKIKFSICTFQFAISICNFNLHFPICTFQFALSNLHFSICTFQFVLFNLQFAICTFQFALSTFQFALFNLQFPICTFQIAIFKYYITRLGGTVPNTYDKFYLTMSSSLSSTGIPLSFAVRLTIPERISNTIIPNKSNS